MSPISLEFRTTDDRVRQLCEHYWEISPHGEFARRVRDVAKDFGLKQSRLIPLINESCTARVTCTHGNESPSFRTRTEFAQYRSGQGSGAGWGCHQCLQKVADVLYADSVAAYERQCEQRATEAAQKTDAELLEREKLAARDQRRRHAIEAIFANPSRMREPADPLGFELKHAVWFLSLVRLGAAEDLSFIGPLESFTGPLSGNRNQDIKILTSLYRCGFIHIDPESPLDAFKFVEDETDVFYIDKVQWVLSDKEHAGYARALFADLELIFREKRWASRWHDDLLQLWRDVALQDCLDFLRAELEKYGFPSEPEEKTLLVLRDALDDFSPGHVFNMIWNATGRAAAFCRKEGVTIQHAANTVPGAIQRHADGARMGGWNMKSFVRNQRYPQPMVSQVLFDVVLQIGEDGMSTIPGNWEGSALNDSLEHDEADEDRESAE